MSSASEKPLLRGYSHQYAFVVSALACAWLLVRAAPLHEALPIAVYTVGVTGMFGVSALYHRIQWPPKKRAWMRRLDHAAIFAMIAGTGTPIFMLGVSGPAGIRVMLWSWVAAGAGMLKSLVWSGAPKWLSSVLYVAVGWMVMPSLPELHRALGDQNIALLLIGGLLYTVGAAVYALRRPDPSPRVFGYHEIFHLLVIFAAVLHFVVIERLVR